MDPLTILTALLPAVTHGANAVLDHVFSKEPMPATIDDVIKLRQSNVEQAKALAELDKSDGAAQWVNNIRGIQRPVATAVILGAWAASLWIIMPQGVAESVANLASCAVFYLFGDRTLMYVRKK